MFIKAKQYGNTREITHTQQSCSLTWRFRNVMIRALGYPMLLAAISVTVLLRPFPVFAQGNTGTITGTVTDMKEGALPGAQIFVEPTKVSAASDSQGKFTLSGVAPGTYNVTISYVGFAPLMMSVVVSAGQTANIDAVLQVASETQQVLVTATQVRGEAEAINQERTTSNIVDVLPADIITSLPNANIADA